MITNHMNKNNISDILQDKIKKYLAYKIEVEMESNQDAKST